MFVHIFKILLILAIFIFSISNIIHFGIFFDYFQYLNKKPWWIDAYNLINGFTINIFAAYLFYWVIEFIPTKKRKSIIKNRLEEQYKLFKKTVIQLFLDVLDQSLRGQETSKLLTELQDIKHFREYFGAKGNERMYKVWNAIEQNKKLLDDIIPELSLLRDEISFAVNNVKIHNEDIFVFLKNFSQVLYCLEKRDYYNNHVKALMQFIWQIFAGWSWVEGFAEKDIVQSIIDEI